MWRLSDYLWLRRPWNTYKYIQDTLSLDIIIIIGLAIDFNILRIGFPNSNLRYLRWYY